MLSYYVSPTSSYVHPKQRRYQVKDKTVKRRVGKKMAPEKRERLEEVAGALVREMGWATETEVKKQRSQTPSVKAGTPAPSSYEQGFASSSAGETVFGVAGYEHQHPHSMYTKTGSAPPAQSSSASP